MCQFERPDERCRLVFLSFERKKISSSVSRTACRKLYTVLVGAQFPLFIPHVFLYLKKQNHNNKKFNNLNIHPVTLNQFRVAVA